MFKTALLIGAVLEGLAFTLSPTVEAKPVRHGVPHQYADHYSSQVAGKALIVKACPARNDIGCVMVWGRV